MKTTTTYFRVSVIVLICMGLHGMLVAQQPQLDPKQVAISSTVSANKAYSPSITSLSTSPPATMVAAYAYTATSSTRRVGISRSTDAGSTWTALTVLAFPRRQGSILRLLI